MDHKKLWRNRAWLIAERLLLWLACLALMGLLVAFAANEADWLTNKVGVGWFIGALCFVIVSTMLAERRKRMAGK